MTMKVVLFLLAVVGLAMSQKPELHMCTTPSKTGSQCMMMCDLKINNPQNVKINKGTTEVAMCSDENTCVVKSTSYTTGSTLTWDSHDNMTMIHFTINSLNISRDMGTWSCNDGTSSSDGKDLKIYSVPTCSLMKVDATDKMNASIEVEVKCAYPSSDVQVTLSVNDKPVTETATKTEQSSPDCSSPEEKSLTFSWPLTFDSESKYRSECSMPTYQWKESVTMKKVDEEGGISSTTIVAIVIVVVFVIVAVIIAIILVRKRKNAKGGAKLAKEPEGEREEL